MREDEAMDIGRLDKKRGSMARRATKKLLRRAEEALNERRLVEAERMYGELLTRFEQITPSLLDHAACVFGLIRTLYALDRDDDARAVAEDAHRLLSPKNLLETAA